MSKVVYKQLSQDTAALVDLLMAQANRYAELAKLEEVPFPSQPEKAAAEEEPLLVEPTAPPETLAADAPQPEEAPADGPPQPEESPADGPPQPEESQPEPTEFSAEEVAEREYAGRVLLKLSNVTSHEYVRDSLKPYYGIDNALDCDINQLRKLIAFAEDYLRKKGHEVSR